jgi:hypothetical protein
MATVNSNPSVLIVISPWYLLRVGSSGLSGRVAMAGPGRRAVITVTAMRVCGPRVRTRLRGASPVCVTGATVRSPPGGPTCRSFTGSLWLRWRDRGCTAAAQEAAVSATPLVDCRCGHFDRGSVRGRGGGPFHSRSRPLRRERLRGHHRAPSGWDAGHAQDRRCGEGRARGRGGGISRRINGGHARSLRPDVEGQGRRARCADGPDGEGHPRRQRRACCGACGGRCACACCGACGGRCACACGGRCACACCGRCACAGREPGTGRIGCSGTSRRGGGARRKTRARGRGRLHPGPAQPG